MDTSHIAQHAGTVGAVFATVFVIATTTMRTMIPLRVLGICTNLVLIATAIPARNYLIIVVQMLVLMVNAYRLHQMLQLVRDVKKSVHSDLSMDWLKPFMTERKCATGDVLFYKDEKAEDMLYIVSGRFRLVESGIELPVGAIVGELGMLSPSNMRTQTLECIEGGLILSVSYTKVEELYVQNPEFGFYFLRLASARLFENIEKLEQRLAQQTAVAPAQPRRSPPEAGSPQWQASCPRCAICSPISSARATTRRRSCPHGLPDAVEPDVSEGIHLLIEYQGARYAQLYVDRLRRFIGKPGVDDAMFGEIARLMAMRMSYQDPIRIAQLKLAEVNPGAGAPARRPTTSGNSGSMNWSRRCPRRSPSRCCDSSSGGMDAQTGLDPLQHQKPLAHSPPEDRGVAAALAAVLGALCQGAGLGRALAAHDRSRPDPAARGRLGDRADRDHGAGLRRRLSPGPRRLACDHRWPRQADLRRRAAACGSGRRRGGGPRGGRAGSAAGRAQAHHRGDQGARAGGAGKRGGGD